MVATLLFALLCGRVDAAPDTLVVCPPAFAAALDRWVALRESQGHRIRFHTDVSSAEAIRAGIRDAARLGRLRFVLLAGDAEPQGKSGESPALRGVPTYQTIAKVNVRWGSEPEIATDNWYADLDDDQLPDLAIGRLTAHSVEELAVMVEKTLAYERMPRAGDWQRRVNIVAGAGGFGPVLDTVLELATKKFLTDGIPPAYTTWLTHSSWRSPYCPDPRMLNAATMASLNEGSLLWIYLGHGLPTRLEPMRLSGYVHHVLDTDDVIRLRRIGGPPIAVFLSCYSGAFDGPRDCLGEALLRSADGPVAVYAGSRVTMPYAMAVMGNELMREYFLSQTATLGETILQAKRRMAESRPLDAPEARDARYWLDAVACTLHAGPEQLKEERVEHILLFNLLGDPLLRLHRPQALRVEAASTVVAGERLVVSGETAFAGHLTLELVCRRDRTRTPPPRRHLPPETDAELAAFDEVYQQANDGRWTATSFFCPAGPFQAALDIPSDARGPCYVVAFVDGVGACGLGSAPVAIRAPGANEPFARVAEEPGNVSGRVTERQ